MHTHFNRERHLYSQETFNLNRAAALAEGRGISGVKIVSADLSNQRFRLEVHFDNGSKSKISLDRRSAVPASLRDASIFSSLNFFGNRNPVEIVIKPEKGAALSTVAVF
ncbi:MAG: hypothetical protein AAFR73_04635 [Pseudomonadota bacterium]